MSLCPISNIYTVTYTGSRADDGGTPEELTALLVNYTTGVFYSPATYDKTVDNDFVFTLYDDGVYVFVLTGAVSGLVMSYNLLVNHNAKTKIYQQLAQDIDALMCGKCSCSNYIKMKGLLPTNESLEDCKDIDIAIRGLNKINDVCNSKVTCSCGC